MAPLAIVDGAYLCLLPPHHNSSTTKDNIDGDDVLYHVPAVPCTEVWRHWGPKCVNVSKIITTMHDVDDEDEEAATGGNIILSKIETIPIRSSDLSKLDFRFIHPENLVADDGNRVVQVSSSCDDNNLMMSHERRMVWSNSNDNCLEICLPSLTSCDANDHDFECLEDDCCDVYGDTSCIDLSHNTTMKTTKKRNIKQSPSFQLCGGGSCLIADFTGVGGYEQALILPQVDLELLLEGNASFSSSSSTA